MNEKVKKNSTVMSEWHFIPRVQSCWCYLAPVVTHSLSRVLTAVNFGQLKLKLVFCRKLSPLKQTKASQGHKQDFQNTPQFLWDLNRIISSLLTEHKDSNAVLWRGASSKSLIRIHKNFKWFLSTISSTLGQRVVSWKKVKRDILYIYVFLLFVHLCFDK